MRLNHFKSVLILIIFLSPIFSLAVQAQTENKVLTITDPLNPAKATLYSGTYVYQGTRSSGGAGPVKVRPYYKNGSYYLYADYYLDGTVFPTNFGWFITNNILAANPSYEWMGWEDSDMNYPTSTGPDWHWWWGDNGGNDVTVVVENAASGVPPSVTTLEATLVTTTSGTMGGNVTADGGAVTDRGFVYSSSDTTPTIGEPGVTQITKGTGTGTYTEVISGLTAGVTYYYQAYGHNEHGTTYGGVKSFTTPTTSAPNKLVSNAGGANGVYVWIGEYYGKPAWKHQSLDYWLYYSKYGITNIGQYFWYIDSQLRDEHGGEDFLYDHLDAATCPSSGWRNPDNSAASVAISDYPQIDFTNGSAYSPGNPTGGTTNNPIGRFFLDADIAGASLTAATITVSGTRTGVSNLKIWSSTDATFNSGSDTQLNSQSDGASVAFSGFSSAISASGTYYFITADFGAASTGTIALTIGSKTNLTYSGGASSTVFTDAPLTSGTITIVEQPGISINDVAVNENSGTATFTITLSKTHSSDITVNYATANNTATLADNDYTNTSGTATITAGQLTTTVPVSITGDTKYETNENFYLNLSSQSYGYISDSQGVGTITNDDSQPSVTLGLSGSPLAENGGTATLTATLSNLSYQNVTVNLGYTGTASGGGTDYSAAASITVNAGSLSNTTTITGVDDALGEGNETVIVDISSVTNGTENGTQQVTATITDDDYSITVNDVSVNENAGNAVFTITLSQAYTSDITIDYATANNTATTADNDYTSTSGTATITATQTTTTVSVPISNDTHFEQNETFYLNISNASFGTITDAQGVGTITNEDTQPSVTLGLSNSPLAENGGVATVTATLSNRSYQNVTVNLGYTGTATGGGTDYSAAASITVNAGSLSNTTSITGVDDALDEGNETVIVDISSVTNGTENGTQQVTATITDDDYSITVNDVSVNENAGNAVFTITLSRAYTSNITIDYATANNTATTADNDYTSTSGTATITATQTTKTVSVPIINDTHYEQNETFYLNISNASFGTITDAQGVGTITNEDTQPSVTLGLSGSPLAENGGTATLTATLSNRSYQNVTVNLGYTGTATGGGTDYSAAASITVNAGSLSNTAGITGVNDVLSEGNETVVVDISSVTNGTENGTQQVTATITDDDSEINVVGNGNTIADGDVTPSTTDNTNFGSTTLSNTISKTFTIQNTGAITLTLGANAVSVSGGQAGDFTITDQPAATISVGSSDTFTIQFSPTAGGTRSTTVNITSDDADENPYNFTIQGVGIPTITSAAYNYNTNVLTVTGTGFVANAGAANDVDISKLTITGEGGGTYTITSATDVEITSATEFSLTLGGVDLTNIETLVNKDGTSSAGGTTYNLAAAEDWLTGFDPAENIVDLAGNGITVSNYANPAITSAAYDASTGVLVVTCTNLVSKSGANNDINASFITITGDGGNSYTLLNTSNVEITSGTSFTLTLNTTDKLNVDGLLNKAGLISAGGQTYNISGLDDWNAGAYAGYYIQDLDNNAITVSNILTPTITNATYDSDSGIFVVTGINFFKKYGAANDIDVSKFTITGEGGTYTVTSATDVEITSSTEFTFTVTGTDKTQIDSRLDLFGTQSSGGTTYNLAATEDWLAAADPAANIADLTNNGITVSVMPRITSATYNAATGVIVVTGTNIQANGGGADIDASKFTITGEGSETYTLTNTPDVERTGVTQFSLLLSVTDWNTIAQIINKNGTSSTSGTTYNIAAADDWCTNVTAGNTADLTGNGITASNVPVPTITSAAYNASTGVFVVTGTGLVKKSGALNDIDISKFTVTGEGGETYNIANTANVEITSGTQFTVTLDAADKNAVNLIFNKNGTSSTSGTTYNLAVAEDWAVGVDAAVNVVDATGNGITVSNVAVPVITSTSYHWSNGVLTATGTGFTKKAGAANDIDASKFTFRGEGSATYTLVGSADVEITSGSEFAIILDATDKTAVNLILNKPGTQSNDNTVYNLAAAEDWAVGADAAINVVDGTTPITAGNFNNPPTGGNDVVNMSEDSPHTFAVTDFTYNDTDTDPFNGIQVQTLETAGELKYNGVDVTVGLDCPDVTKLVFTSAPNINASPYATFTFKVKDNRGAYSIAAYTMTINVIPVIDVPVVLVNAGVSVNEGGEVVITDMNLKASDSDSPEHTLLYVINAGPFNGTLNQNGFTQNQISNGAIKYTHDGSEAPVDSFKFVVRDSDGGQSDEETFLITVISANDPPKLTGQPTFVMNEDEEFIITNSMLLEYVNDADDPDSLLSIKLSSQNENINLSELDNSFHVNCTENWFGTGELLFAVSDGKVTVDTTVNITVNSVNDLPILTGLPLSIEFKQTSSATIDLNGKASDVESPDSVLVFSFSSNPDSVKVALNNETLIATVVSVGKFTGDVLLTVKVTDESSGSDEGIINVTVNPDVTGIELLDGIPEDYVLFQNYPNPFNPITTIKFDIPKEGKHIIKVYNVIGEVVGVLADREFAAGRYQVTFDASTLPSGIYFYQLQGNEKNFVRKMLMVK